MRYKVIAVENIFTEEKQNSKIFAYTRVYLFIKNIYAKENRRRLKANRVHPSFGTNGHEDLRLSYFRVQRSDEVTFVSRTKKDNYVNKCTSV